jgi:hypothetical protein
VVDIDDHAPFGVRRKPAFAAVRRLVDRWGELTAGRAEQRLAEEAARREMEQSAGYRLLAAGHRAAARPLRGKLERLRARYRRARREQVRARLARQVFHTDLWLRRRRSDTGWARAIADLYALRAAMHEAHAAERAAFVAGG